MGFAVECVDSAAAVFAAARGFLDADPIAHNIIATILQSRLADGVAMRCWLVRDEDAVVHGLALQSPPVLPANLPPMPKGPTTALASEMAATGVRLPGIAGSAATAAWFAGEWTERTDTGAVPEVGFRLYEQTTGSPASTAAGRLVRVAAEDHDLAVSWIADFYREIGEPENDPTRGTAEHIAQGLLWMWDGDGPKTMLAHAPPCLGVVRIRMAYTPPSLRCHGYASAAVSALSAQLAAAGHRRLLFTHLANPVANRLYRRIGYRAVGEALRYRFL